MDSKEVFETILDAEKYVTTLLSLQKDLKDAENQIISSSKNTIKEIDAYFKDLTQKIVDKLTERKNVLIRSTETICNKSLAPITSSQTLINGKIIETQEFISLAKSSKINLDEFKVKASNLGNLPQVPQLKEVTCITFLSESRILTDFLQEIPCIGSVIPIAPVQICKIVEKPGALLVQWEVLDAEDLYYEVQEFHLQKAIGLNNLQFRDVYQGSNLQFLVQDLNLNQEYSFRIRCKFELTNEYCPWSAIETSHTTIEPFMWLSYKNVQLANNSKIASNLKDDITMLSKGAQFKVGDCIEFTFLECDDLIKQSLFIGILPKSAITCENTTFTLDPCVHECFLVDNTGNIFINGVKKSTILPKITKNSMITFISILLPNDNESQEKLRISIDISEKQVTYDWNVDTSDDFYFVASIKSSKWKILVE